MYSLEDPIFSEKSIIHSFHKVQHFAGNFGSAQARYLGKKSIIQPAQLSLDVSGLPKPKKQFFENVKKCRTLHSIM